MVSSRWSGNFDETQSHYYLPSLLLECFTTFQDNLILSTLRQIEDHLFLLAVTLLDRLLFS